MKFQVTSIEFDFADAFDPVSDEDKSELYKDVLGGTWEAHDEEDLLDEISACTGWCIKSIHYRNVLTNYETGWALKTNPANSLPELTNQ
jgi:hypothetical protein|tara:strand:- start:44 stop:310 length:267 start_codon:yes stop_codon:yes gene_type:complete